jgi:NADH dehydrogenase
VCSVAILSRSRTIRLSGEREGNVQDRRGMMAPRRVSVFGGSGFVGRAIVARLAADGAEVRVAVRHPERASLPAGQVSAVRADVWDEASVAPAVEGADAVVNTVGHYVERGGASFEAIHGEGARNVAAAAQAAGVERLVHISGIGADPASPSAYVRARAEGERLVRQAFPAATILRPSVMFGPEDAFFNQLADLARVLPVLPLFGNGAVRLQPVYVKDTAAAVARALVDPAALGRTYELGGPRIYAYADLVRLALEHSGRRRLLLPLPYLAWDAIASLAGLLPNPPLSRDQVTLMRQDNVADPAMPGFADLGIAPRAPEAILPTYLRRGG